MNSEEKKVNQEVTERLLKAIGAITPVTWEIVGVYYEDEVPIQFEASYVDVLKNISEANTLFNSTGYLDMSDFLALFPSAPIVIPGDIHYGIPVWCLQCFEGYDSATLQMEDPTSRNEHGQTIFEIRFIKTPCDGAYECCSDVYCYCD